MNSPLTKGYALLTGLLLFSASVASGQPGVHGQIPAQSSGDQLRETIRTSPVFAPEHTGFMLFDPVSGDTLCALNEAKYFTPASNIKLLTLLTVLHVLGDSTHVSRYGVRGDTLFFSGMADPSLMFRHMPAAEHLFELLRDFPGPIVYVPGEEVTPFGPGWSWDDYRYGFQCERSLLPIHGNRITLTRDPVGGGVLVEPRYFTDYVHLDNTQKQAATRDYYANAFTVNPARMSWRDTVEVPFVCSDYEMTRILADTLKRPIGLYYDVPPEMNRLVTGTATRELLQRMMQESDNLIAEQLLMQCAFHMTGSFQPDSAIAISRKMILGGSPDSLLWTDGSGLSRYNLLTPRSIVFVLTQIRAMMTMEEIMEMFPAGGVSGTISDWYKSNTPFIYAKTGTLRNQHNLSGFLLTDSGRWLIFSFMHNNFPGRSSGIKPEMERILQLIRSTY